jgi:biotin carboxylase
MAAGLPVPWFVALRRDEPIAAVADRVHFPCVVKPTSLSGSRGVIRADTAETLDAAVDRVRRLLRDPALAPRALDDEQGATLIVEGFIPGAEFALEGVLEHGRLRVFAIFEKPEPLDGPYFEETVYVTPPRLAFDLQRDIAATVAHAAAALGLRHGPVHAEVRTNASGVYVLEVAPRPIGGLCSRALRFVSPDGKDVSLEAALLEQARGGSLEGFGREGRASAVLMIPVPATGYFRGVDGVARAEAVPGVDRVLITAMPGQLLRPAPEGASYPGFIFARAPEPERAVDAVRQAHGLLRLRFDKALTLALP